MSEHGSGFFGKIDGSFLFTVIGIILLFSSAIGITLLLPRHIDPSWITPSSYYQTQMYTVADPNFFISSEATGVRQLTYVNRLENNTTLLAFQEGEGERIIAPPELEKYITRAGEKELKLTPRLLLLREPMKGEKFDAPAAAAEKKSTLQAAAASGGKSRFDYKIQELYDPGIEEVFAISRSEGVIEDFVDDNFTIVDGQYTQEYHRDPGVIFVKNPIEYRVKEVGSGPQRGFRYDPAGKRVESLEELTSPALGFRSRRELIAMGQQIYAHEGCYYCHTQQTRTLVQDVVLNGSKAFPAPPSSPNEYIYMSIVFPGTKRNGPDLSRVGIKKPSRDWHKSHFWSPKTESEGSIMPSFRHFFDFDPRGSRRTEVGVPNHSFEAIYQYLMTQGTRITPPTEAWWLGKDPVNTLEIIEGRRGKGGA